MKKVFKITSRILGLIFALTFLGSMFLLGLFSGIIPQTLNAIDNLGDPCYELNYPGKGPRYIVEDDNVCVNHIKARYCVTAGWGAPCLQLKKSVKGADSKTFVIHYGTLASDKSFVYIDGEKTDFDRSEFKFEQVGHDSFFYIGDDKYRVNGGEAGYTKVN